MNTRRGKTLLDRTREFLLVAITCVTCLGCASTIKSQRYEVKCDPKAGENTRAPCAGVSYYLPMRLFDVRVSRTEITLEDKLKKAVTREAAAAKAKKEAETAFQSAKRKLEELPAEADESLRTKYKKAVYEALAVKTIADKAAHAAKEELKAVLAQIAATDDGVGDSKAAVDAEKALSTVAKSLNKLSDVQTELTNTPPSRPEYEARSSMAKSAFEVFQEDQESAELAIQEMLKELAKEKAQTHKLLELNLSVTPRPMLPDPKQHYIAWMGNNQLRKDDLDIKTTPSGLLTSSSVTAESQVASALTSLASAAGLTKRAAGASLQLDELLEAPSKGALNRVAFHVSHLLNPTSETSVKGLTDKLETYGVSLHVDPFGSQRVELSCSEGTDNATACDVSRGLIYRRELPIQLTVSQSLGAKELAASTLIESPNGSPVLVAPTPGSAFGRAHQEMAFKDGMLVSYSAEQPSEIAAIATLPAELIRAYLGAVSELFTLHVDIADQAATLAEKRKLRLESERALEDTASEIGTSDPDPTPTAGEGTGTNGESGN